MDLKDKDKLKNKLDNKAGSGSSENKKLPAVTVKALLSSEAYKKRFTDILGQKAAGFIASVINVTNMNKDLAECDPHSVVSAAAVAATLDLPIDPNLGFSAMVPFNGQDGKKAQFQIMWRGYVQLGVRTGLYENIHVTEVYRDELAYYNPLNGEIRFTPMENWKQRYEGLTTEIVGYYAFFRLLNGFNKGLFMTTAQIEAHGRQYSKSYHNPKGKWKTDFMAMAKKTVIKLLMKNFGIMSVDIQRAIKADQAVINSPDLEEAGAVDYVDGTDTIDNAEYQFSQEDSAKLDQELAEQDKGDLGPDLFKEETK